MSGLGCTCHLGGDACVIHAPPVGDPGLMGTAVPSLAVDGWWSCDRCGGHDFAGMRCNDCGSTSSTLYGANGHKRARRCAPLGFGTDGDVDVVADVDVDDFWRKLSPDRVAALLKRAPPKVAFAWKEGMTRWTRDYWTSEDAERGYSGIVAVVDTRSLLWRTGLFAYPERTGVAATLDEARAAADEALRAGGWLLAETELSGVMS